MGRGCSMDEWAHFQKLPEEGRVPNSSYWYVICRHCMLAYEQKQLPNAPEKLTGRRSAMHSHLKSCPIYGAEYNMELKAKAEAEAAEATATDPTEGSTAATSITTATSKKRKRRSNGVHGGRGKHCMMEEWEHFNRLREDGYIGNSNFFYAVCRYCQKAYDEASEDQKSLLVPEKLVGRREKLRKHLMHCSNFKGELPSLERQIRHRIGGIPHSAVINTLAAKATRETGNVDEIAGPAVEVVSAHTNMTGGRTGSTRMMLDEWQYFTRIGRKKDSAYYHARCNFCQQAYENAPESLKTSMEPPYVTGRKSNMQTHLTKCPHIPQEWMSTKAYDVGVNYSSESEVGGKEDVPLIAKRINQDIPQETQVPSPDGSAVHRALVEVLLEHHLPFGWVESASAKKLFCALVPVRTIANALMPSAADLRTCILDEIHHATLASELTKLQELIPLELAASAFSACVTDTLGDAPVNSWPVMLHCNLEASQSHAESAPVPTIDGIVTNGKAVVPLSFVRDQSPLADIGAAMAHHHGLEVARWLDAHIRNCIDTAKLAPVAVVLPFSTVTQRAVGVLRASTRWPQVVFTADVEDLLYFPLIKLLTSAEMFGVVSSLIELWQLESIRSCVMERLSEMNVGSPSSPFRDWRSCTTLIQVFLDDRTFKVRTKQGAPNVKRLVDGALNRPLLERVYNLLLAFINAFTGCHTGLSLSEALKHLGVLFAAAEGIITVQLALEVVWAQLEQPLFALAHALDPRLRALNLGSTEITKLSALSDISVAYFVSLFGRKSSSLRGEVTAYLHTSQRAFTSDVISEFPVVDDYFRYLSDNHPSLAMLMQVLHSFSSVSTVKHLIQEEAMKTDPVNYTREEQQKLEYLRGRWSLASVTPTLMPTRVDGTKTRIAAHDSRSGAALLNAGIVMDEWKETLEAGLLVRGVDFALLDNKFDGTDDANAASDSSEQNVMSRAARVPKLPSLALDDEVAFPSTTLREPFSVKVLLKDLFKTAEATI